MWSPRMNEICPSHVYVLEHMTPARGDVVVIVIVTNARLTRPPGGGGRE